MAIRLTALTTFRYDGRVVLRDQSFLAKSKEDAHILTVIRKAQYDTKALTSTPVETPVVAEPVDSDPDVEALETPKPKRTYRRRNLTAEE